MKKTMKIAFSFMLLFLLFVSFACNGETTTAPTTEVPTTEVPTTEAPTTEAPTTEAPTTEVPTTETPTSEEPTTEVPTTETPTTDPNGETTETPVTTEPNETDEPVEYVFEAEHTYLDDLMGAGYSGGAYGTAMIVEDRKQGEASNGHYVSYLYSTNIALTFEIVSSEDVDDAVLILRLSAELRDFVLTSEMYTVMVNGMAYSYDSIEFTNVPGMQSDTMLPFEDFVIGEIALQEGMNEILLITTNSEHMAGTMYATAPMVDCIKIITTAELTWDPMLDNIFD